jgi:hypothetical protein
VTIRLFAGALLVVTLLACASPQTQGARTAGFSVGRTDHRSARAGGGEPASGAAAMNQAELQQALQRIATQFQGRVGQISMEANRSAGVGLEGAILRQALLYQSSILDIATGPEPELNLLDMAVFAQLCAKTLKSYWTSQRLGDASAAFSDAFAGLDRDVQAVLIQVLTAEQRALLQRLIDGWLAENRDQRVVEGIRLVSFGRVAGEAADERGNAARGLLSSVKTATRAADRALLLAERALYLSQRVPFLLRAHARLGAREMTGDTLRLLDDVDSLLQRGAELRPMLAETADVLALTADVAEQVRVMSRDLDPMLQRVIGLVDDDRLEQHLASAERLSSRFDSIVTQLDRMQRANTGALTELTREVDALVRRWIAYLALAGAGCVLFYWACYYVVKRHVAAG